MAPRHKESQFEPLLTIFLDNHFFDEQFLTVKPYRISFERRVPKFLN